MGRGLEGRPAGVQYTSTVSLGFVYASFKCRIDLFLFSKTIFYSFGLQSNVERLFFFILRLLKKSIPCLLLAFYGFITNIKMLDPFELVLVLGR